GSLAVKSFAAPVTRGRKFTTKTRRAQRRREKKSVGLQARAQGRTVATRHCSLLSFLLRGLRVFVVNALSGSPWPWKPFPLARTPPASAPSHGAEVPRFCRSRRWTPSLTRACEMPHGARAARLTPGAAGAGLRLAAPLALRGVLHRPPSCSSRSG